MILKVFSDKLIFNRRKISRFLTRHYKEILGKLTV